MNLLQLDHDQDKTLKQAFRNHVTDADFPCVGAKSALARGSLKLIVCHDITSAWDDLRIHSALLDWSHDYARNPEGFRSLGIIFRAARELDEAGFEHHMWDRIQSLSDKDDWLDQGYDDAVSSDPDDPHFGLSFGGEAYFVVGLHPNASRPARRFERPAMIFNLHDQFETLRKMGRYERMREAILHRDEALAGSINPMLTRHGEASAAAQYSGRVVDDTWQCPFSDPRK